MQMSDPRGLDGRECGVEGSLPNLSEAKRRSDKMLKTQGGIYIGPWPPRGMVALHPITVLFFGFNSSSFCD